MARLPPASPVLHNSFVLVVKKFGDTPNKHEVNMKPHTCPPTSFPSTTCVCVCSKKSACVLVTVVLCAFGQGKQKKKKKPFDGEAAKRGEHYLSINLVSVKVSVFTR